MKNNQGFINILLAIVVVLLLGAGGYYAFVKKSAPVTEEPEVVLEEEGTPEENQLVCGLAVESPTEGAELIIGQAFQVKGYVNGCGWTAFEAEAAVVSIEDANGGIVMVKTPVPVSGEWMQLPAYFDSTFTPNLPATAGTGFVIFENEDPSGENPQMYKVPITFGTD